MRYLLTNPYIHIYIIFILVEPALEELHIKLLRKIKKTVPINRWEKVLAKFAYSYSNQDAWELERFGYKNSSIVVKLRVLKVCRKKLN